jgi:hypothetical protein
VLFGTTACLGQTASKSLKEECVEVWELNCNKAKEITMMMQLYPLQVQKNSELEQLQANLIKKNADETEKLNNKIKRRSTFTKIFVGASFIVGIIIGK